MACPCCVSCDCYAWDTEGFDYFNPESQCEYFFRDATGTGCGYNLNQTQSLYPQCADIASVYPNTVWKEGYPSALGPRWALVLDFSTACCRNAPCASWSRVRVLHFDCDTESVSDKTADAIDGGAGGTERLGIGVCFPPFCTIGEVQEPDYTIPDPVIRNICENPFP